MSEDQNSSDDFIARFREKLATVDEFVALVLNGHLEIEGHLEDIITLMGDAGDDPSRIGFYRKLDRVRASRRNPGEEAEWGIMLAFNTLRNQIAHRSKKTRFDLVAVRNAIQRHRSEKFREEASRMEAKELVVYAAAVCCGFLCFVEIDVSNVVGIPIEDDED